MTKRRFLALFLGLVLLMPAASWAQEMRYEVDFDYTRHFAPTTMAWLYQAGSGISQPVVYSADEDYYLSHTYDGRSSKNGAIFMTGETQPDPDAQVFTLHGNNCMDYSLFGSLSEYREPEYYQQNPSFTYITPEAEYRLDVFAGVRVKHKDRESWVVNPGDDLMGDRLPAILEASFLTADPALLPEEGDRWVVMTTEAADNTGNRYVIYTRMRPMPPSDAPAAQMNELDMDSRETRNGYAGVVGVGSWMIYGQNDPRWNRLIFEVPNSSRRRPFGDGGCGPTSIAMAIANLVPKEDLPKIREYALNPLGYVFCTCCIGNSWCDVGHVPYQLNTPDEYLRYFPLAVADFAMGNNTLGVQGRRDSYGTNMSYLDAICSIYGITVTRVRNLEEALPYLREGNNIAVCCTSGTYSPFTNSSHFMVLARATDDYIYALDPLRRDSYETWDHYEVLELLTPGLVRVKLENAQVCHFNTINILSYQPETK